MVDQRSILVFVFLLAWLFQFTLQQLEPLSSSAERAALLQLRSSLSLRSKDWPRKADPCLLWTGINCRNGSVVGINISGFRRTRVGRQNPQFAVDALANLTLLEVFNASRFFLAGPIPEWFGQRLPALQVLDLRSCSVNGAILSSIGSLTNLTGLYLSQNSLTGAIPTSLNQLLRLSVLDLSQNSLTGSIPLSFASLGSLSILDISSNYLSGSVPPGIGTLQKLQYLNLSNNGLTSAIPAQLGDLSRLVDLDLSVNFLSGSVSPDLRGMRNLRNMFLGNNLLVGSLPQNSFPSQLQLIVLRNNNFTGVLPVVLWSMTALNFLDISGNNFTGLLPNSSLSANFTAAVLNLSQNSFYGGLTPVLGRYSTIDLSGNYFEGGVPSYVPKNASVDINCLQNVSNQRRTEECVSFYTEQGLIFNNSEQTNSTKKSEERKHGKSYRKTIILAVVFGGLGLSVFLVLLTVLLLLCAKRPLTTNQRGAGVVPAPPGDSPKSPGVSINLSHLGESFAYQELLHATDDFSNTNLIKNGNSGDLYRGLLENGIPAVIKKVDLVSFGKESYLLELDFYGKASHQGVVPLLGYCLENENEKFLVYKYMPNGDLSNCLHRKSTTVDGTLQSLDWITRLKIALGAAESLSYLHHECTPPFVHRDVQASSILLDDKYDVRLGSLSEVCVQDGDTHQSRITRLLWLPQPSEQYTSGSSTSTCAYDVYCFGKVLLELVTGKLGISASSDADLKDWLDPTLPCINIYDKESVTKIVDPTMIVDEDLLEEVWATAIVARSCLNPKPSKRPIMRHVLKALENPLKVVREENSSSERLRTTSSRGSWNAALFGSWRQSSSDSSLKRSGNQLEGTSDLKRSGTVGSQGSYQNGAGEFSFSRPRHSKEIPPNAQDV